MTDKAKRQTSPKAKAKPASRGKPRQKSRGAPNTSDTADARWTVRGVPTNVREMAVNGAKERNMTVGDWLAELIVLNRKAHTADEKANVPAMPQAEMVEMMTTLNDRLTKMEQRQNRSWLGSLFGGQDVRQEAA
jgi:hypothetical protein